MHGYECPPPPPKKKITSLLNVLPTYAAADVWSSDLLILFMELFFSHHRISRRSLCNTFRVYPLFFCSFSQKGSVVCTIHSMVTRISSSSVGRTIQFFISFYVFLGAISSVCIAVLIKSLIQGCIYPRRLNFSTLVPNICGSLVWNLIHVRFPKNFEEVYTGRFRRNIKYFTGW
jgi:hypothetical protein